MAMSTASLDQPRQALLQRLMSSYAISESKLVELISSILRQEDVDVVSEMKTLSNAIENFGLKVNHTMYDDGKTYWGVIHTRDDDLAKSFANGNKPQAIVLFRKIIENILQSPSCEITESEVKNLREGAMSVSDVMILLSRYKHEKWLVSNSQKCVTIGPRCLLELAPMLRSLGVVDCPICSCDVVKGISCQTPDCTVKIHASCGANVARSNNGTAFNCPNCTLPIQAGQRHQPDEECAVISSDDE